MPLFWLSITFLIGIALSSLFNLTIAKVSSLLIFPLIIIAFPQIIHLISSKSPSFNEKCNDWLSNSKIIKLNEIKKPFGKSWFNISAILLISIIFGAARYQADIPNFTKDHLAYYNDTEGISKIVGVVIRPPEQRDNYINLWVNVEKIEIEHEPKPFVVEGKLLAQVNSDSDIQYGDIVYLSGELQEPLENEEFSYKDYLARQGIYSQIFSSKVVILDNGDGNPILSAIYSFKENALDLVYRFFPDPEASIMAGILLGVETGISSDLKKAFQDTGTSHIIAISGFNITIIAGLFSMFFSRAFGKRRGAIFAVLGIVIYTVLVGASPAVVRAAIMGGLSLFARQVGRRQDGLNSLAFTAALMCLFNPFLLWDVGFQLSFMATLGLVLYAEDATNLFVGWVGKLFNSNIAERLSGPVGEYFLFTVAAQITILPVIAYHFQKFSYISFPANFIILPAQAFIMIFGGLAILFGSVIYPVGQLISYLAWPFVAFTIRIVEWFSQFRGGALIFGRVGLLFVISYYIVLFGSTIWGQEIKRKISNINLKNILLILGMVTVFVWQGALNMPDGKLHVTMMDVGTGDAILIETPEGRFVLVNGGSSAKQLSDQIGRWLPLFHRKLDFLVISSTEESQIRALPNSIERFLPDQVLWAGDSKASRSSRYLERIIIDLQLPVLKAENGQVLSLGEGIDFEVLAVGSRGAILLLIWDDFRMLMPLGMSFEELKLLDLGDKIGPVSVLVLADNGYGPLNPKDWIDNLHSELILLSVQAGDYDGLPSQETLEAVGGYTLLRTDQNGWINIETDGKEMWVEAERGD